MIDGKPRGGPVTTLGGECREWLLWRPCCCEWHTKLDSLPRLFANGILCVKVSGPSHAKSVVVDCCLAPSVPPVSFPRDFSVTASLSSRRLLAVSCWLTCGATPAGGRTSFGQVVEGAHLDRMWTEMHSIADVRARCAAVDDFNARNRYRKRGLCVLPTMYGINFGISFLCQGAALVMIYTGELLVGLRRRSGVEAPHALSLLSPLLAFFHALMLPGGVECVVQPHGIASCLNRRGVLGLSRCRR